MMQMSAELYARIGAETGQDVGWHGTGSLRLASSANRWLELKRSATIARSIGFEMHLLSPQEACVEPDGLTQACAKGARAGGVRIVEGVAVTGVRRESGRITGVQTTQGD